MEKRVNTRRLSGNALLPKFFIILIKTILGISTICLWLSFQVFLNFEQNCYFRAASQACAIGVEMRWNVNILEKTGLFALRPCLYGAGDFTELQTFIKFSLPAGR